MTTTIDIVPVVAGMQLGHIQPVAELPSTRVLDEEEYLSLRGCIEAIVDYLVIHGLKPSYVVPCVQKTMRWWSHVLTKSKVSWVKFVKYKLAAHFSSWAKTDMPKSPEGLVDRPDHLLCGAGGRFLISLLKKARVDSKTEFFGHLASLKLLKKGMPRPSKKMVDESVASTVSKLTTADVRPCSFDDDESRRLLRSMGLNDNWTIGRIKDDIPFTKEQICEQLRRTVREVLSIDGQGRKFMTYSKADRYKPFFPSTSAHYIKSRGEGGAVGFVMEHPTLLKGLRKPGGFARFKLEGRGVRRERGEEGLRLLFDDRGLDIAGGLLWERLLKEAMREIPEVEPVGLAEALKVRVITKGPAASQTVMKPLQRFLFRCLKRFDVFLSLGCGGDISEMDMNRIVGKLPLGTKFLSGDYEAATDNLKSYVSETIWDEICQCLGLSVEEREIGSRLLTHHIFGQLPQKSGQLMGSIISFPVLCIANFALCRRVVELDMGLRRAGENGSDYMCPVMIGIDEYHGFINGDDCSLCVSEYGRRLWVICGGLMGLIESLGKTYYSDDFLEINSRLYVHDGERLCFTPLINLGLVYGLKRSAANDSKSEILMGGGRELAIGARHQYLFNELNSASWGENGSKSWKDVWPRLNALFMKRNGALLASGACKHLPWFVPTRYGGLGLHGEMSRIDVSLLRAASLNGLRFHSDVTSSWKVWQLVTERVRKCAGFLQRQVSRVEADREQGMFGRLVANTLFDSNLSLSDLILDRQKAEKVAVRHNERLWSQLSKGRYGFPPPHMVLREAEPMNEYTLGEVVWRSYTTADGLAIHESRIVERAVLRKPMLECDDLRQRYLLNAEAAIGIPVGGELYDD